MQQQTLIKSWRRNILYLFSDLSAGYYLVYVTGGKEIQSSLVTVDADRSTVNLKTETPSINKTADKTTVKLVMS